MGGLCPSRALGGSREADVPTEPTSARQDSRFPRAHGDEGRPKGVEASAGQRATPADGLSGVSGAAPAAPGLPRAERLRSRAEFDRLFRRGARVEDPAFVLLWRREPGPRAVGFAVGRRLGGSVVRNRARRRLREAYRRQRDLVLSEGIRLCFIARQGSLTSPFDQLVGAMAQALARTARGRR
jgi:ribonuclease P protein component